MHFNKILIGFVSLSIVLAYPAMERREGDGSIVARAAKAPVKAPAKEPAKAPAKPPAGKSVPNIVMAGTPGTDVVGQARKANTAPGREVPKMCKKVSDCSCPKDPNSKTMQSTSCINGTCSCNNAAVNFAAGKFVEGVTAVGNSPVVKAVGHVMKGIADVKQVVGAVAGKVLGPVGKLAVKGALNVIPDTGTSHIDDATKGVAGKILNAV